MADVTRIVASLDMLSVGDRICEHDDGLSMDEYDWDQQEWSLVIGVSQYDGQTRLELRDCYDNTYSVRRGWNYLTVIRERAL
jgi:hypothetical protein